MAGEHNLVKVVLGAIGKVLGYPITTTLDSIDAAVCYAMDLAGADMILEMGLGVP